MLENYSKVLLEQIDHEKRTIHFEEAFEILDGYISDNPKTFHRTFIENLRLTYIKKLLEGLSTVREHDIKIGTILSYGNIFLNKADKEFRTICEKYPKLEEEWESFLDFFRGYIE